MLEKDFGKTDLTVLINGFLGQLFTNLPKTQAIDNLTGYYAYEKQLESTGLAAVFPNFELLKTDLKRAIFESNLHLNAVSSTFQVIEELVATPPPKYPLLTHLRLCKPRMTFDEYCQLFSLKSAEDRARYPKTAYLIANRDELMKLKVVIAFKEFYELFGDQQGVLRRGAAEGTLIPLI